MDALRDPGDIVVLKGGPSSGSAFRRSCENLTGCPTLRIRGPLSTVKMDTEVAAGLRDEEGGRGGDADPTRLPRNPHADSTGCPTAWG